VYLLYAILAPSDQPESTKLRMPVTTFMLMMGVASLICYAAMLACMLMGIGPREVELLSQSVNTDAAAYVPPKLAFQLQPLLHALGGLFAFLGLADPFVRDLFKMRIRRIWALAKLSVIEALRARLFIIFLMFMAVFLFPVKWFMPGNKPEDEIRLTLDVTAFASTLFLLVPALILSAFRIPKDINEQTIYTIVTKPVERFEIVLGRFLGYATLLTITLGFMTFVGWVYITYATTFDAKAVDESQRARVPLRGELNFRARTKDYTGTNVGREFEYRKYIAGSKSTTERGIYSFDDVPSSLASGRDQVPCEFTFDIFRLTKGEENRGVDVNIRVTAWQCGQKPPEVRGGDGAWLWNEAEREQAYREKRQAIDDKLRRKEIGGPNAPPSLAFAVPGTEAWKLVEQLAEEFGFYEIASHEVYDYHPGTVYIPTGVFKKAREGTPPKMTKTVAVVQGGKVVAKNLDVPTPRLNIAIKCLSPGQMLGMAQGDLYIMEGEKTFTENYFKNALGLWCRAAILIGIAITLSTYLSGVIALLATVFIYISAYFAEHLRDVATSQSTGGGPFESLTRLLTTATPTTPLDENATQKTIQGMDAAFAWLFRRYENIVPNIDAFTWTNYLKEGFNINGEYLILNLILLFGYLLPWAMLSYYLIRNREVAA
jgi:hypothetical protein